MSARRKSAGPLLLVSQVGSGIGYSWRQKATLEAMGLGRVGSRREMPDNPQVRGMIAAVSHLVVVENDADPDRRDRAKRGAGR